MSAHWNYRVIEFIEADGSPWRAIYEVHYDAADKPVAHGEEPAVLMSSDYKDGDPGANDGLKWALSMMAAALDRPVLVSRDFATQPPAAADGERDDSDREVCHPHGHTLPCQECDKGRTFIVDCRCSCNPHCGCVCHQAARTAASEPDYEAAYRMYERVYGKDSHEASRAIVDAALRREGR